MDSYVTAKSSSRIKTLESQQKEIFFVNYKINVEEGGLDIKNLQLNNLCTRRRRDGFLSWLIRGPHRLPIIKQK